jgi:integrase
VFRFALLPDRYPRIERINTLETLVAIRDNEKAPDAARVACCRDLLLADIRRLLDYLKARQQGYGSALAFHLANALFQTACRFDELIQLAWGDCQRVGGGDRRLSDQGSVFQDVPFRGA